MQSPQVFFNNLRIVTKFILTVCLAFIMLNDSALAASANITATGRIVYEDESGALIPVRGAKIVLYDDDFPFPEEIETGWTENDGTFSLSGEADDIDICAGTIVGDECCQGLYASNCSVGTPYGDNLCCPGVGTYEPNACDYGDLYIGNGKCCPALSWAPAVGCWAADEDLSSSYPRCNSIPYEIEMVCAGIWTPLDYPDPYIQVEAVSEAGKITIVGGAFNYCMQSIVHENVGDGAVINFGDIMPDNAEPCCDICIVDLDTEDVAWHWHNELLTVYEFMLPTIQNNPGGGIPFATVIWPSELSEFGGSSFRDPTTGTIHLHRDIITNHLIHGTIWQEEVLYHEYGHHILHTFADSPTPFYWNEVCDNYPAAGHCAWRPEDGCFLGDPGTCDNTTHFTEAFPNFLSKAVAETTTRVSIKDWETPLVAGDHCNFIDTKHCPKPGDDPYFVEGISTAILWDLFDGDSANPSDPANDNHDRNNSRDRLSLSFEDIWDVIMNYDPDPWDDWPFPQQDGALYWVDHPVTIDQFYDGIISTYPNMINRVSEIFHENHLERGAYADLFIHEWSNTLQGDPLTIQPGESLSITDVTANSGESTPEIQGVSWVAESELPSITRFYILYYPADTLGGVNRAISDGDGHIVGERRVDSLPGLFPIVANAADTATTTVTIPVNTLEGPYYLTSCSDAEQVIFESDESNNCTEPIRITIRFADNDGDGHRANVDCDDSNENIFPGAIEVCNGLDDDCDQFIDERLPRYNSFLDFDGDGYGDATTPLNSCYIPANHVLNDLDCDDSLVDIHPDAFEICNNIDDNCDGSIDEGFDADNDTFKTCDGDCNDGDPTIYPGMTESCNNQDDNCDGNIDEGFHSDADNIADCFDNCPYVDNPNQDNLDGDAEGDVCDPDDDNDSVVDLNDNCPAIANQDQADNDNDGFGDLCDDDDDNDGVTDNFDACPLESALGYDADNNGCLDSVSELNEIMDVMVIEGIISGRMQNSLTSKLNNADKSANKNNICDAIDQLGALLNQIAAQRGKKISVQAADLLTNYVNNLIVQLNDQLPVNETCS